MQTGNVKYWKVTEMRTRKLKVPELPFSKRYPFQPEQEFRILFESCDQKLTHLDIPLALSCIDRITLSPWMHNSLSDPVKAILKSIDGCAKLKVSRSTLIGNDQWKDLGESATE